MSKSTALHTLNARRVETAQPPPGKTELTLHDGGNLALRIRQTSNGVSKAWQFPFRIDGKRDKVHIGEYPAISLAGAREIAAEYRSQIALGLNPKHKKVEAQAIEHAKMLAEEGGATPTTLGELAQRFHGDYMKTHHEDGGAYAMGMIRRHVLTEGMAEIKITLIRPIHVKTILDRMYAKGLRRSCGVVMSLLRQMVHWAATFEWLTNDPTLGLKKAHWKGAGNERERVLSEAEIVQLFHRLRKSSMVTRWKHTIWLILATSTRIEETMLAQPKHVDLTKGTWTIPPENQKKTNTESTAKPHVVHLSPFARKHMQALLNMPGTEQWIFPARDRKDTVEASHADAKTLTKLLRNLQGGEQKGRRNSTELLLDHGPWTPHDLRRTTSSLAQDLGHAPNVIDKCQNHVPPNKIQRTYQRGVMQRLMKALWDEVGEKLEELSQHPDPEPDYVAPRPKAIFFDKTDAVAAAKRKLEISVKNASISRKPHGQASVLSAKLTTKKPAYRPTPLQTVDFGDSHLI